MRIALLTRSYPADDDLYKYPFVHRRVLAYKAAGHDVRVVRLGAAASVHVFEGVECLTVRPVDFDSAVFGFAPDVVAVHGLDEMQWPAIASLNGRLPVCAWLHGSEIPSILRAKALLLTEEVEREHALELTRKRTVFWQAALSPWPSGLRFAFPSQSAAALFAEDVGAGMRGDRTKVISNPIDTILFPAKRKMPEDALRILSIRPHDSWAYANDLAVKVVLVLQRHSRFTEMRFTFVGDGPLFDETFAPLQHLSNVTIRRGFLRQQDIPLEHATHGVFLAPSRLDTQGVSRDEAMSSGLVPVTNRIHAIPEFVDGTCAGLAAPEDVASMADEIACMIDQPEVFLARSRAAASRVRAQSAQALVIPRDLEWMQQAVDAHR
ncbi:glycosyltransferase involved in cell wall biosynthesis [Novosphingobium sp. PhB57]|uniref:glycosyltransferase family 4 protein n=1 Tax=Novosphingobium sp. PhB57 TaxID=2485107 RepID=UPI0010F27824|nr:glycosyltransferase family 4 protein [Novosphingobium sp. PhB57]TCU59818.1 glycosyltransferase involved in cell wall biosynthesis [Novosphingobium sp. PhB57]